MSDDTRSKVPKGLDTLSDDELRALRVVFRKWAMHGPIEGMRAACACLNEVDARLTERGYPADRRMWEDR